MLLSDSGRGIASDRPHPHGTGGKVKGLPLIWDPHPDGMPPLQRASDDPNLAEAVSSADGEQPGDESALAKLACGLARRWKVGKWRSPWARRALYLRRRNPPPLARALRQGVGRSPRSRGHVRGRDRIRLADRRSSKDAVTSAVAAATQFVSDGYVREDRLRLFGRRAKVVRARKVSPSLAKALELAERVRKHGGTISATDACFDALRRDHVRCLEAAARLGDRLVVLLNSDHSASEAALPTSPASMRSRSSTGRVRSRPCASSAPRSGPRPVPLIDGLPEIREVPHLGRQGGDPAAGTRTLNKGSYCSSD